MWAAIEGHPEVPQDATLAAFREILLAGPAAPRGSTGPFFLTPRGDDGGRPRRGRGYIPMKSRAWSMTSASTVA